MPLTSEATSKTGGGFAIRVSPPPPDGSRSRYVFPFLRYLEDQDVGTLDIVEVLIAAMNALDGGAKAKTSADQSFWNKSMRVVLARIITLLRASDLGFSLESLMRAMSGLPLKGTKAPFFSVLKASASRSKSKPVQAAIRYFDEEFRTLEPRTSGSIRAVWSAMAAELEQSPLDQLLAEPGLGQLVVTPSTVLDDRIPVILDLPTLVYPRSGGVFQALFHQCLKIALHKRKPGRHVVGIVQDEFQASVPTSRELTDIMTTARSKGVGGIYATQSLSNVMAVFGRDDARAIFGAPNMLIACRNDDADTRNFVSERSGEHYYAVESETDDADGFRSSVTRRQEKRPAIEPYELSELQRPLKRHWRPRAATFVLRGGEAHVVKFDRLVPGWSRRFRGLVAWTFDFDAVGWLGVLRRMRRVSYGLLCFAIILGIGVPAVAVAISIGRVFFERVGWSTPPELRVGPIPTRASFEPVRDRVHTVRRGDTLQAIADRNGVADVQALSDYNSLPSIDRIEIDQHIRIPPHLRGHGLADAASTTD